MGANCYGSYSEEHSTVLGEMIFEENKKSEDLIIKPSNFITMSESAIRDRYLFEKKIGEGTFGEVYKAKNKLNGEIRAIKFIRKKAEDEEEEKKFFAEINILRHLV